MEKLLFIRILVAIEEVICFLLYSYVHDQLPPPSSKSLFRYGTRACSIAHSNCSERLWLYARAILVALENYSGWLGELN